MASITVDTTTGVDATSEVGPHARIETINKVVELLAKRGTNTPTLRCSGVCIALKPSPPCIVCSLLLPLTQLCLLLACSE